MTNKIISSFVFGLLLLLPLDFLLFIGLKKHYFDFYKIDVYFNVYFVDNQPYLALLCFALLFGFLVLYAPKIIRNSARVLYLFALIFCFSMLFRQVATELGSELFGTKDLKCAIGKQKFEADLLYEGRRYYYLKRKGIRKTLKIPKNELVFL